MTPEEELNKVTMQIFEQVVGDTVKLAFYLAIAQTYITKQREPTNLEIIEQCKIISRITESAIRDGGPTECLRQEFRKFQPMMDAAIASGKTK